MLRELTDSEALVAALAGEAREAMVEHPEMETLLAYHEETLPPDTEESVRDHLVGCRRCTRSLLDLAFFEETVAEPPGPVADLTAAAAWRDFKSRIDEADRLPGGSQPLGRSHPHPALYALAASLLLAVVGLSFWVAQLRGGNTELRQTVAELSAFQVNQPVVYLEGVVRGDEASLVVELARGQPSFQVIAIPSSTEDFSSFQAALFNPKGQVIWSAESTLSEALTLRFVFHRYRLPTGRYRLQVYGLDGERRVLVNDGLLSLRYL